VAEEQRRQLTRWATGNPPITWPSRGVLIIERVALAAESRSDVSLFLTARRTVRMRQRCSQNLRGQNRAKLSEQALQRVQYYWSSGG
jgi:hypothetical protein